MIKKNKTFLEQNKYRTYPKLNTPEQFNFVPLEEGTFSFGQTFYGIPV